MTTTVLNSENAAPVPVVGPEFSLTEKPAFPDAHEVIARIFAIDLAAELERAAIQEGTATFAAELADWSKLTFVAQTETLPEQ